MNQPTISICIAKMYGRVAQVGLDEGLQQSWHWWQEQA